MTLFEHFVPLLLDESPRFIFALNSPHHCGYYHSMYSISLSMRYGTLKWAEPVSVHRPSTLPATAILASPIEELICVPANLCYPRTSLTPKLSPSESPMGPAILPGSLFGNIRIPEMITRLNQIPSHVVRGAYHKVRVSSGQCQLLPNNLYCWLRGLLRPT